MRDSEQGLLGLILSEPECKYLIYELKPEYFTSANAQELFKVMQLMYNSNEPVEIESVKLKFKEIGSDIKYSELLKYLEASSKLSDIPANANFLLGNILEAHKEKQRLEVSEQVAVNRHDLKKVKELIEEFEELEDSINAQEIKNFVEKKKNQANFSLKEILSPALHGYLKSMCTIRYEDFPIEVPFTFLLSIIASLAGSKFTVEHGFKEHAFFWSAVALPVGAGKTPVLSSLMKPLGRLQCEALEEYEKEKEDYKSYLEDKKELKRKNLGAEVPDKPKPVRKRYDISNSTMETACKAHFENPNGLLWDKDELKGLFNSLNSYKGGRGEDKETLLQLGAGARLSVSRQDTDIEMEQTAISVTGGIQPSVLKRLIAEDKDNDNGLWERFVYVTHESMKKQRNKNKTPINHAILTQLYSHIIASEGANVTFADPDFVDFVFDYLDEEQEKNLNNPFMESYYSKCSSLYLRLSLLLHILDCHFNHLPYERLISKTTSENAFSLLGAFISHAETVFSVQKTSNEDQNFINKIMSKPLEKRTVNDLAKTILKRYPANFSKGSDYARYLFELMQKAGLGTINKAQGKNWQFILKGESI